MSELKRTPQTTGEAKPEVVSGQRGRKRKGMCFEDRPLVEPNAAGIDIGAREIFVAVPLERDEHPVRMFATFTEDLQKMAAWLVGCGITPVAMESTGVYWIALYDVLEPAGIKPCLVNPRNMKNVPGRRTDWHECQWLQFLHSVGLLRAAFRPEAEVVVDAAPRRIGGAVQPACAAHAQSPDPDESADPSCDQRYYRPDGARHCGCALGGRKRCDGVGPTTRPAHQGQRRDHSQIVRRQLAPRASD